MASRKMISGAMAFLVTSLAGGPVASALAQGPMPAEMPQPTQQDNLKVIATNLNNERSEFFRKKDLVRLTSVYTPDATYIELLPEFIVMKGRTQIQQHVKELLAANASNLVVTTKWAQMTGEGKMITGGDYYIMAKGKRVFGHFFEELRHDEEGWKIARHVFARNEFLTSDEGRSLATLAPRSGVPSASSAIACSRISGGAGGGTDYLDCLARQAEKQSGGR